MPLPLQSGSLYLYLYCTWLPHVHKPLDRIGWLLTELATLSVVEDFDPPCQLVASAKQVVLEILALATAGSTEILIIVRQRGLVSAPNIPSPPPPPKREAAASLLYSNYCTHLLPYVADTYVDFS